MIQIPQPQNLDTECLLRGFSILLRYYPNLHLYSESVSEYYLLWTDDKEISEQDVKDLKEWGWEFSNELGETFFSWKYEYGWYLSNSDY